MSKMEEFKTITGSENYEVSNFGRVRNKKTGKILKYFDARGYCCIKIKYFEVFRSISIHRLCAIEFIKNPNNYRCVNHKDGNKKNNNISNLEWCTHSQNSIHAYAIGLNKAKTGESCPTSKLTNNDVLKIRDMIINGYKIAEIAVIFSVHYSSIIQIKNGNTWNYI